MSLTLYAVSPGDESVGMRSVSWALEVADMDDDPEVREAVREDFRKAFSTLTGDHVVITFSDEPCEEEPREEDPQESAQARTPRPGV